MSEVYPSSSSSSSCLYDDNHQICFEFQPQTYQLQYDPNSVTYEIVTEAQEVQLEYVSPVDASQPQQHQWQSYYEVESSSNQVGTSICIAVLILGTVKPNLNGHKS